MINWAVRDRLQSATAKVKIFNNFIYMQGILTKFTPHTNGALMIVLQHVFAKLNSFNFSDICLHQRLKAGRGLSWGLPADLWVIFGPTHFGQIYAHLPRMSAHMRVWLV